MKRKPVSILLLMLLITSTLGVTLSTIIVPVKAETQQGPMIDTLRYNVIRSPAAQVIDMQIGPPYGSDVWAGLTRPTDSASLQASGKTVTSRLGVNYARIVINLRNSPLDDINFRHALAHLVPKDRIIGSLFTYLAVKTDTPVPPAQGVWHNPSVDPHPYSRAEAEAILTASGYKKIHDVWKDKNRDDLHTLSFLAPMEVAMPGANRIVSMIVEEAQAIGLNNIVKTELDLSVLLDQVFNNWEFDLSWAFHVLDRSPTHIWHQFHSINNFPGSSNPHGTNYPALDTQLDQFWQSLDYYATVTAASAAQELLMGGSTTNPLPQKVNPGDPRSQALPTIPLYSINPYDAQQPELTGAINMFGYGVANSWSLKNMYWQTDNNYRPGTTEKTIEWLQDEFPERLNPLWASSVFAWNWMKNVFDGLIEVSPYTHADVPWLATSWSCVAAPDGMDITFNIRLNDSEGHPITWQDGTPISINDAKFSWDFLHDRMIPLYWDSFKYYDPAGTVIVDTDTIKAHMTTTSLWLLYDLADTAYMLPPSVWTQDPRDGNWSNLDDILLFDPSASPYPDPDGEGPLRGLPTCLFGTGPFVLQHSTTQIALQGGGDLNANRYYFMTTTEIQEKIATMFHFAGDVNYDGQVDTGDMSAIGVAFNTVPGDDLWNPNADITGPAGAPPDLAVNIFDAAVAGKFFGESRTIP